MLEQAMPAVQRTQERILEPLTAQEKKRFSELLFKLCNSHSLGD